MRSADDRFVAVGVTGGPGCGKSAVAAVLAGLGVPVLDADDLARAATAPGTATLRAIAGRFGSDCLRPDGSLDRARLAARVFGDPEERKALEALVHPEVRRRMTAWKEEQRQAARPCAGVIPLLYETGGEKAWDTILCIAADEETATRRLRQRGWDDAMIAARRAAQWPLERKVRAADHVIWNNGTLAQLESAVRKTWNEILEKESRHGR